MIGRVALIATVVTSACAAAPSAPDPATTETIVLLRHGEKPAAGLGQLTCQGLNRALALPAMLIRTFGRPAAIFAPNPAEPKRDAGRLYDYVRPLATIEPTAIALAMPVDTSIGLSEGDALQRALETPALRHATVFVAWEHKAIVTIARALLAAHGAAPDGAPPWPASNFDQIFILRLHWTGPVASASLAIGHERLDGQSQNCPGPARSPPNG